MKVVRVEVYEKDLQELREIIPSTDSFAEKFRVLLGLIRDYEDSISKGAE